MRALLPPAGSDATLRLYTIVGNACEPELRGRDMLMVATVDRHLYDGDYLLDFGYGEAPYRASGTGATIHVRHLNPLYGRFDLSRAEFNAAVRAIIVAQVRVKDHELMKSAYLGRAERRVAA